ncbi:MAG: cupin domain-containing protein [Myxococcota bacterium]
MSNSPRFRLLAEPLDDACTWRGRWETRKGGTTFGVVREASVLQCGLGRFPLAPGMYFSVPASFSLEGGSGFCVRVPGFEGFFQVGGPIEAKGRLRYINGCTDSLLIPPVICGDPCLNFLHLPAHSAQAMHTHPSVRIGVVMSGEGRCVTMDSEHTLRPGMGFIIEAGLPHAFRPGAEPLRVVAFHPDSDVGPKHDDHPMINRTLVEGISARHQRELHTER